MPKLSTQKPSTHHRAIIYGAPKTGKTLLAGRLAEKFNLIWFDLENGHETLFQLPKEQQERIQLVQLPDTRSFPIAIETCLKIVKPPLGPAPHTICEEHGKVTCLLCAKDKKPVFSYDPRTLTSDDVVVFDSATQLTNSCIAHITKNQPDDYKLEYDDWAALGKLMDIFFSHIQQAKYNVVVISHETDTNLEEKGKTSLVPVAGTRNFSRNVAKYFDHVIYASRVNLKHKFASSSTYHNTILTGSRTDVAIEEAGDNASLLQIFCPDGSNSKPAVDSLSKEQTKAQEILKRLRTKTPAIK